MFWETKPYNESVEAEEQQREKRQEHIRKYFSQKIDRKNILCVCCGNKKWALAKGYFKFVDEYGALGSVMDGLARELPVALLSCVECGHIMSFDAQKINQWDSGEEVGNE